ncbi:hypothetical protein L6V77_10635 [Myxococcota bacterium]|nr:hypothetical protein [Myxococcota bacterium]
MEWTSVRVRRPRPECLPRRGLLVLLLAGVALAGCGSGTEGTEAADECSEAALGPFCPVGSYPELSAEAEAACRNSASGGYDPLEGNASGAVSGACTSHGACRFICRFEVACACGVERISRDDVVCRADCGGCGDGNCSDGETPETCAADCAVTCGDGACDGGESAATCPEDCGDTCGDGRCEGAESPESCPGDCAATACGDGECRPPEDATSCPRDCGATCGNGTCEPGESVDTCESDCGSTCGDGLCEGTETPEDCPSDCSETCGDGVCEGAERPETCPRDCGPTCGNGECEPGEDVEQCPRDCGPTCGNGECEPGENVDQCPRDCSETCGDGVCEGAESAETCDRDCGATCGNGECEPGESAEQCPRDCGATCGNGDCEPGESVEQCPRDCLDACGNGRCLPGESPANCPADCTPACGDGLCGRGENAETCARDCAAACGDRRCEGGESPVTCPFDCGGCVAGEERCNGTDRDVCGGDGDYDHVACAPDTICRENDDATTECVPVAARICVGVNLCCDGALPRNEGAVCDDGDEETESETCMGGSCVDEGPVPERCGVIGDEDRNGLADCADPVCAEDPVCCVPDTCDARGASCGLINDRCGGVVDCGTCPDGETCGGGADPHGCGCTPLTCADLFATCGEIDDGCGGTLNCGACRAPETCGGGGLPNACGVRPCIDGWCYVNPLPAGEDLYGVSGTSASDVWAVGDNLHTQHWDGDSWTLHRAPAARGADGLPAHPALIGVWSAPDGTAIAVGATGVIYRWSGGAWQAMDSPTALDLKSVWGSAANDVWAVGAGGIFHYDGRAWTTALPGFDFADIHGRNATDVWAVGAAGRVAHYDGAWAPVNVGADGQDFLGVHVTAQGVTLAGATIQRWDGRQLNPVFDGRNGPYLGVVDLAGQDVVASWNNLWLRLAENPFDREWLHVGRLEAQFTRLAVVPAAGQGAEVWAVGRAGVFARYVGGRWVTNLEFKVSNTDVPMGSDRSGPLTDAVALRRLVNGRTTLYPRPENLGPVALDGRDRLVALNGGRLIAHDGGGWRVVSDSAPPGGSFSHVFTDGGLWVGGSSRFDGTVWQTVDAPLVVASTDERERWVVDMDAGAWETAYLLHVAGDTVQSPVLPAFITERLAGAEGGRRAFDALSACGPGFVAVTNEVGGNGFTLHVLRAAGGSNEWRSVAEVPGVLATAVRCTPDGTAYLSLMRNSTLLRVEADGSVARIEVGAEPFLQATPGHVYAHLSGAAILELDGDEMRPVVSPARWPEHVVVGRSPGGAFDIAQGGLLFRADVDGFVYRGQGGWTSDPYSFAYLNDRDFVCEGFSFVGERVDSAMHCADGHLASTAEGDAFCSANGTLSRYTAFGWQLVTDELQGPIQVTSDGGLIGACANGQGVCHWLEGAGVTPVAGGEGLGWPQAWAATSDLSRVYGLVHDWAAERTPIRVLGAGGLSVEAVPPFEAGDLAVDGDDRLWLDGNGDGRFAVMPPPPGLATVESDGVTFGLTTFPTGLRLVDNGRGGLAIVGWGNVLVTP